jgi:hypothetical protein
VIPLRFTAFGLHCESVFVFEKTFKMIDAFQGSKTRTGSVVSEQSVKTDWWTVRSLSKTADPLRNLRTAEGSAQLASLILIVSGLIHLGLYAVLNVEWEGPLSPRKPGLFGVSAGVTAISLLWCAGVLLPNRSLKGIAIAIAWALLLEVSIITVQYWRGVPSHFNRTTILDGVCETLMVAVIIGVTIGIGWFCWISMSDFEIDATTLLAIRSGLWFLLLSCGLGFITMAAGEWNRSLGRPAEIWGNAGILKYPHGAALHAIQTIPLLDWLLRRFAVRRRRLLITLVIVSHAAFLFHAIWQTFNGRARLDVDLAGGAALLLSIASITIAPGFILLNDRARSC